MPHEQSVNTPAFRQKGITLDIWPDLVLDRKKWDIYTRLTDENMGERCTEPEPKEKLDG